MSEAEDREVEAATLRREMLARAMFVEFRKRRDEGLDEERAFIDVVRGPLKTLEER